jgi:hypothetical protein
VTYPGTNQLLQRHDIAAAGGADEVLLLEPRPQSPYRCRVPCRVPRSSSKQYTAHCCLSWVQHTNHFTCPLPLPVLLTAKPQVRRQAWCGVWCASSLVWCVVCIKPGVVWCASSLVWCVVCIKPGVVWCASSLVWCVVCIKPGVVCSKPAVPASKYKARHLYIRGASRADLRGAGRGPGRGGAGPQPQALPAPASLVLCYLFIWGAG